MTGLDELVERAVRSKRGLARGTVDWTPVGFFASLPCPGEALRCYLNPHGSNSVKVLVEARVVDECRDECVCRCLSGKPYDLDCSARRIRFEYKGRCVELVLREAG